MLYRCQLWTIIFDVASFASQVWSQRRSVRAWEFNASPTSVQALRNFAERFATRTKCKGTSRMVNNSTGSTMYSHRGRNGRRELDSFEEWYRRTSFVVRPSVSDPAFRINPTVCVDLTRIVTAEMFTYEIISRLVYHLLEDPEYPKHPSLILRLSPQSLSLSHHFTESEN